MDRALTGDTSLNNEAVKSVMKRLKKGYVPKPAKAFDVAEVLPRFMAAIFLISEKGEGTCDVMGVLRDVN